MALTDIVFEDGDVQSFILEIGEITPPSSGEVSYTFG